MRPREELDGHLQQLAHSWQLLEEHVATIQTQGQEIKVKDTALIEAAELGNANSTNRGTKQEQFSSN